MHLRLLASTTFWKSLLWNNQFDDQIVEIRKWLSPSDSVGSKLGEISFTRGPKTGEWFLQEQVVSSWFEGNDPLFVLQGVPGCGKTYFWQLVHAALSTKYKDNCDVKIIGYSIKYDDTETLTVEHVLSALLAQVVNHSDNLSRGLRLSHRQGIRPNLQDMLDTLEKAINLYRLTFIVLDALDEFPMDVRRTLMSTLFSISLKVRIFVTSRPLYDEVYHMNVTHKYDMQESNIKDILIHIRGYLGPTCLFASVLDSHSGLRERIISTVVERCSSIFLIANFDMERISECRTLFDIERQLKVLPTASDDMYSKAIKRIKKLDWKDPIYVIHALMWIFDFPSREYDQPYKRLDVNDLLNAVACSMEDVVGISVADARLDRGTLIGLCGGLIVIDSSGCVDFVHVTARAFIQEHQRDIFPLDRYSLLASAFLKFSLSRDGLPNPKESNFWEFGKHEWIQYVHKMEPVPYQESQVVQLLTTLYTEKKEIFRHFLPASVWLDDRTPLPHIMIYLGFLYPFSQEYPIDSVDWKGRTFLHFATFGNQVQIVKNLLTKGANPDPFDNVTRSPLSYAAANGQTEIVQLLLLQEGVDPDSRSTSNRSPLSYAAGSSRDRSTSFTQFE